MKKIVICSKWLLSDIVIHQAVSSPCRLVSSTFLTSANICDDPGIYEPDDFYASRVIQDKHLLRKSHDDIGGTGLHVLDLIDRGSLKPDRFLYNQLLRQCTQAGKLREGRIVHAHILKSQFGSDVVMRNTIVNMYVKCGCLVEAREVFDEMPERDVVTWTMLITGYSRSSQSHDALILFPRMLREGLNPNQFALSSLVKAAAAASSDAIRGQIHAYCFKTGYDSDVYVGSSLVDAYARVGAMSEAGRVFDKLPSRNEVSWNALIAANARNGESGKALELFLMMRREGFESTPFTFSSLCTAFANSGSLEQGKWVHIQVIKSGGRLAAFVGNTLLNMYAKSGCINDARKIFDRLVSRDLASWNSMLSGYARHGLGNEAMETFEEMSRAGVHPNGATFLYLITACIQAGSSNRGQHYFNLMKMKYGLEPEISHYVAMVELLGRSGLLDRAMMFIRRMPIEPTAAVWGAMLSACRMHRNMELGVYAAERVFALDPNDSRPHMLLYSMYTSAGRWDKAFKVRKMMQESGVSNKPACSWVQVENTVHMFIASDGPLPDMDWIRETWERISKEIGGMGYVPDTSRVHLMVNQRGKEAISKHHSEELALAFAIINTPPGLSMRVVKNIRVCGDCHTVIKYV